MDKYDRFMAIGSVDVTNELLLDYNDIILSHFGELEHCHPFFSHLGDNTREERKVAPFLPSEDSDANAGGAEDGFEYDEIQNGLHYTFSEHSRDKDNHIEDENEEILRIEDESYESISFEDLEDNNPPPSPPATSPPPSPPATPPPTAMESPPPSPLSKEKFRHLFLLFSVSF